MVSLKAVKRKRVQQQQGDLQIERVTFLSSGSGGGGGGGVSGGGGFDLLRTTCHIEHNILHSIQMI